MLLNPFSGFSLDLSHEENVQKRVSQLKTFKAKADAKRTPAEKFADFLTTKFGSVVFLGLNATWFIIWILINTSKLPIIDPFDPYPFGFLTMVVSLEAIFLAIIVLISQNREARIGELREEIELQVSTIAEGELTKLINLMVALMEKEGVKIDDPELRKMLKPVDQPKLEKQLENELTQKPS
ncbi:MAG: DUF1003 domain-containing protein [Patescibacteria group bacterium]